MNTFFESLSAGPATLPPSEFRPTDSASVSVGLDSARANLVTHSALDLADLPRLDYNPLFLFGPSGTGKTSLLRAFAQRWSDRAPADQVHFCTASDYARSYANALETDGLSDFRQPLLSSALWLLDDLPQLAGKQQAQWELLRLIEMRSDRWLVLSANLSLADLPLIPQLTGQLSCGLALPLAHPDWTMRRQLVQELCTQYEIELAPSAISELVSQSRTRRQLEHTVLQLTAICGHDDVIDREQVLAILADTVPCPDLRSITSAVARQSQITVAVMRGPSRRRHVVRARGIAMLLTRQNTQLSLRQIGVYFGKRDHSTVRHAIQQAALQVAQEPFLQTQLATLGLPDPDHPAPNGENPLTNVPCLTATDGAIDNKPNTTIQ